MIYYELRGRFPSSVFAEDGFCCHSMLGIIRQFSFDRTGSCCEGCQAAAFEGRVFFDLCSVLPSSCTCRSYHTLCLCSALGSSQASLTMRILRYKIEKGLRAVYWALRVGFVQVSSFSFTFLLNFGKILRESAKHLRFLPLQIHLTQRRWRSLESPQPAGFIHSDKDRKSVV